MVHVVRPKSTSICYSNYKSSKNKPLFDSLFYLHMNLTHYARSILVPKNFKDFPFLFFQVPYFIFQVGSKTPKECIPQAFLS
jgi:hypothetical protein